MVNAFCNAFAVMVITIAVTGATKRAARQRLPAAQPPNSSVVTELAFRGSGGAIVSKIATAAKMRKIAKIASTVGELALLTSIPAKTDAV